MVAAGQCIAVTIGGEEKTYFRTSAHKIMLGAIYYFFCEVKPQHEISLSDVWGLSEKYYEHLKANGMLREIK